MKSIVAGFFLLVAAAAPAWSADKAALPGYVIARSEVRTLPVNAAGRHYALFIGLPVSYATEPGKRYPVVYVTDQKRFRPMSIRHRAVFFQGSQAGVPSSHWLSVNCCTWVPS
jgi:hypothetical protein